MKIANMARVLAMVALCSLCESIAMCDKLSSDCTHCTYDQVLTPGLDYYCVLPSCNTPCPLECDSRCNDLHFYTPDYFKSDTTFKFISGTHHHTTTVELYNIANLTFKSLKSEDTVSIECSSENDVGFVFIECLNITIKNMAFSYCGQEFQTLHNQLFLVALAFQGGSYVTLDKVNVSNSSIQGLLVSGVEEFINITESRFIGAGYRHNQTTLDSYIAGNSIFAEPNNITSENVPTMFGLLEIFIDKSEFISNKNRPQDNEYDKCDHLAAGLTIVLRRANVSIELTELFFTNNSGCRGGNLAIVFNTSYQFTGQVNLSNSQIHNGIATFGGGLYIFYLSAQQYDNHYCKSYLHEFDSDIVSVRNTTFEDNMAKLSGGGFYARLTQSLAICTPVRVLVADCSFHGNSLGSLGYGGVALHSVNFLSFEYMKQILPQFFLVISESFFHNHTYTLNSEHKWNNSGSGVIYLKTNHHVEIENIAIYDNLYSGIVIADSNLIVSGSLEIYNNNGSSGGGMLFCSRSIMFLRPNASITISDNNAVHAGGGICVEDQCLQSKPVCFFQPDYEATVTPKLSSSIKIYLYNNTAGYAGDQIYGGSIDFCYIMDSPYHNVSEHGGDSVKAYNYFFEINPNLTYSVTSPQRKVCLCYNESHSGTVGQQLQHNCSRINIIQGSVYPGEPFNFSAAVVGQLDGIVPGTVHAELKGRPNASRVLPWGQVVQKTSGKQCSPLHYIIYTNESHVNLSLSIEFVGDKSFAEHLQYFKTLEMTIYIKDCPLGFTLSETLQHGWQEKTYTCVCLSQLHSGFRCTIDNETITPRHGYWIGYFQEHNETRIRYSDGCTLDYCKNTHLEINENNAGVQSNSTMLVNPNNQCQYNRTGILCGKCSDNYSAILGNSDCRKDCSYVTLLLIPLFAVMGILLVVVLMALNITVTEGTISGLLFYANIVQISNRVFFRGESVGKLTVLLKIFIAWLNLDFGIPVCLYTRMDDYAKAWLQFVFPLYIWLITGVIIYVSRHSTVIARLANRNGIKVLATLMLLSYTKMIRAATVAVHFKVVRVIEANGNFIRDTLSWYSDGNVFYMQGKHIPLGIIGFVSATCLMPFSFLLLFVDLLNKIRIFSCMWRLKPFLDAYTGPYTNEGRYWTGLLLVVRCVILLASTFNHSTGYTSITVTLASMVIVFLSILPWVLQTGIYRKRWLNILECSFLLNLGVLTTGTQYLLFYDYQQELLTHASVGTAFITFVCIVGYHICQFKMMKCVYLKVKKECYKRLTKCNMAHDFSGSGIYISSQSDSDEDLPSNFPPLARFDQDREPLLSEMSTD